MWLRGLFSRFKKTGYRKDYSDERDFKYEEHFKVGGSPQQKIPNLMQYGYLPNQGRSESCVGYTLDYLLMVILHQETGQFRRQSPMFIWYNARLAQGWQAKNTGVYPRDAFKKLFDVGSVPQFMHPDGVPYYTEPDATDYKIAYTTRDLLLKRKYKYYRVGKVDAITLANNGQPVAVSLPISRGMYRQKYVTDQAPTHYYHYMALVGEVEKDDVEYLKFMNWWGKGYIYIPKEYYMKYSRDLWTITNR